MTSREDVETVERRMRELGAQINVWNTSFIVRIDPHSGDVVGRLDLSSLPEPAHDDPNAVLNGIAYDEAGDRLFVTGKLWQSVFEVTHPGR
jgi:glutamine cyclotransferase